MAFLVTPIRVIPFKNETERRFGRFYSPTSFTTLQKRDSSSRTNADSASANYCLAKTLAAFHFRVFACVLLTNLFRLPAGSQQHPLIETESWNFYIA